MKKQQAFLKRLTQTQLNHLKLENKFSKASGGFSKGSSSTGKPGSGLLTNFTREGEGADRGILFAPKTKGQLEAEREKQIGSRSREPWEVDKVICIRFEVWGERKKMIKKGQIIEHREQKESHFDKIFRAGIQEDFVDQFAVPSTF